MDLWCYSQCHRFSLSCLYRFFITSRCLAFVVLDIYPFLDRLSYIASWKHGKYGVHTYYTYAKYTILNLISSFYFFFFALLSGK